jgi:hypothetical protein
MPYVRLPTDTCMTSLAVKHSNRHSVQTKMAWPIQIVIIFLAHSCLGAAELARGSRGLLQVAEAACSFQGRKCFPSPAKVLNSSWPSNDGDR